MERETGIGPATNSLEGCDSTTELLPLSLSNFSASVDVFSTQLLSQAADFSWIEFDSELESAKGIVRLNKWSDKGPGLV